MGNLINICLTECTWQLADVPVGGEFLASPADANSRGLALTIMKDDAAYNLSGAHVYLIWRHRQTHKRGTEEFSMVSVTAGKCSVCWPASMACAEGWVDCQIVLSVGDAEAVSTPTLGFEKEDAAKLAEQIKQNVPNGTAIRGKLDDYGQHWTVRIPVTGKNGRTALVETGWIVDRQDLTPRLLTAFVVKEKKNV